MSTPTNAHSFLLAGTKIVCSQRNSGLDLIFVVVVVVVVVVVEGFPC